MKTKNEMINDITNLNKEIANCNESISNIEMLLKYQISNINIRTNDSRSKEICLYHLFKTNNGLDSKIIDDMFIVAKNGLENKIKHYRNEIDLTINILAVNNDN